MALVSLFMTSSVKEGLASPNPSQRRFSRMLVGVKVALKLWLITLKSRVKLENFFKTKTVQERAT
jgi:hypothetical protein